MPKSGAVREAATAQRGAGIVTTRSKSLNPNSSPFAFARVESTHPAPAIVTASAGREFAAPIWASERPSIHR